MNKALAQLAAALLTLGLVACGGSGEATHTTSQTPPTATTTAVAPTAVAAKTSTHGYLNDGDKDQVTDEDPDDRNGNKVDEDNDYIEDHRHPANYKYQDTDDRSVVAYGHEASAAERSAITAVVERYHAAELAGDGTTACALIYSPMEETIVQDYGGDLAPAYLHGNTCQAVMSHLFSHLRGQFDGAVTVTGVRVKNRQAIVLLGSTTLPAGEIAVRREHNAWKINALVDGPLS